MILNHTHKKENFSAMVVLHKDKKSVRFLSPKYYQHFLNMHTKVGDKLTVVISNKKPKRTVAQNNYYWGAYLPLIAQETGEEDIERLHELFKAKFLTKIVAEVLGQKVRICKSTTELSVSEFIEFIQKIQDFTGIEAPPTENYSLMSMESIYQTLDEKVIN